MPSPPRSFLHRYQAWNQLQIFIRLTHLDSPPIVDTLLPELDIIFWLINLYQIDMEEKVISELNCYISTPMKKNFRALANPLGCLKADAQPGKEKEATKLIKTHRALTN